MNFLKSIFTRPFCWGIIVASITWIVTFLLYLNVSKRLIAPTASPIASKLFLNSNNSTSTNYETSFQPYIPNKFKSHYNETSLKGSYEILGFDDSKFSRKQNIFESLGMIKNAEDQFERDMGYKQHAFNAFVSNQIGLSRDIPDTRHKVCLQRKYSKDLPVASIVICFFNEHLMTLLRSVYSIFQRTPLEYVKEIILVDDYSDFIELKETLEDELRKIDKFHKIKLIRNKKREGLIRSRTYGAREATGDILIFLDSHIEVNIDWLEPLLDQVQKENSTLAVPVIDIINADTFLYTPSPLVRGGFNWGLHFKWENLPEGTLSNETSFAGPFISPTMAGGLFAVNRQYFKYIGEYDMGMNIWGGENLEISFRVWQCGGSIKILPCSRVGHIFRKRRPYKSPDGSNTMLYNSLRAAYVWMDDYKDLFLKKQKVEKDFDFGNIDDRILLRKELKCKPFSWYLQNVYPELNIPGQRTRIIENLGEVKFQPWHSRKRNYVNSFMIRLSNTSLCISVDEKSKKGGNIKRGSSLSLRPCKKSKSQIWYETDKSELVLQKLFCLEAYYGSANAMPVLGKCHEMLGDQEWKFMKKKHSPVYNVASGTCLRATNAVVDAPIVLDLCAKKTLNSWDLI